MTIPSEFGMNTRGRDEKIKVRLVRGGPGPEIVREYDWMNCHLIRSKMRAKKSQCPINSAIALLFQVCIGL